MVLGNWWLNSNNGAGDAGNLSYISLDPVMLPSRNWTPNHTTPLMSGQPLSYITECLPGLQTSGRLYIQYTNHIEVTPFSLYTNSFYNSNIYSIDNSNSVYNRISPMVMAHSTSNVQNIAPSSIILKTIQTRYIAQKNNVIVNETCNQGNIKAIWLDGSKINMPRCNQYLQNKSISDQSNFVWIPALIQTQHVKNALVPNFNVKCREVASDNNNNVAWFYQNEVHPCKHHVKVFVYDDTVSSNKDIVILKERKQEKTNNENLNMKKYDHVNPYNCEFCIFQSDFDCCEDSHVMQQMDLNPFEFCSAIKKIITQNITEDNVFEVK